MLNTFLQDYRDNLQSKGLINSYDLNSMTEHEKYVINTFNIDALENLLMNMNYLDSNIILIKKDLKKLFENIYEKLDNILELAEGYQKLNTNELIKDNIENFLILNIKNRLLYDDYNDGICLPRTKAIKNILNTSIERDNINAKETYKLKNNIMDSILKVNILNVQNTILKRISFINSKGKEISYVSGKSVVEIPKETTTIEVATDNVNKDLPTYTSIDLIENLYVKSETVTFDDLEFKIKKKYLKLVFDYQIPTSCAVTVNVGIRSKNSFQENISFNLGNNNKIFTTVKNSKDIVQDIYGNKIDLENLKDSDIVLSDSKNTDNIKYLGNNILDLSNLNTNEFILSLSLDLYSLTDSTKTPIIKGIYAYVTN